jgi:Asp/Glu/hydantoin racemase
MRVRSITPIRVPEDELERRRERYARLAPPGVDVHLDNLVDGPATPRQLETDDDVARSSDLVLAMALETDPAEYDLVLPDCVLDPAVARVREEPVPIVGILQLVATNLAMLGRSFTAVTRNRAIADELADRIEAYGLAGRFHGVDVLDLDFEAIQDDRRWHAALAPSRMAALHRGAQAVINGCSAVDVDDDAPGAPAVDPTGLALRLLGASADVVRPAPGPVDGGRRSSQPGPAQEVPEAQTTGGRA